MIRLERNGYTPEACLPAPDYCAAAQTVIRTKEKRQKDTRNFCQNIP